MFVLDSWRLFDGYSNDSSDFHLVDSVLRCRFIGYGDWDGEITQSQVCSY